MLRFVGAGEDLTLRAGYEPPRPGLRPDARLTAMAPPSSTGETWVYDGGKEDSRTVRFASSETQGFLTPAEVTSLITLYEAGGGFQIETDLLLPPGSAAVFYDAVWEPGTVPEFTPAVPNGSLYYLDLLVRVKEV